ncbi:MAG: hypothetical protein KDJ55_07445 [Rhodobiaceae bacterium]|nr:hypothetical protein [Rhodobiaceae bacterium]MCC0012570.1 hypothetical protein [Rhodobiaceae bacterium]MCC0050711.1 hypothetical protein [Rhodobiaceae bacterium]MCC0061777.1 hypothetical protein [Rhodobiaceae bacterium]
MSSPDARSPGFFRAPSGLRAIAAACLTVFVAGCSDVRPLYEGGGAPGNAVVSSSVEQQLAQIDVEAQETRVGQRLRNDLLFRLGNGANPSGSIGGAYMLDLRITRRAEDLLVRPELNRSTGRFVTIVATYTLRQAGAKEMLTTGTVQRSAAIEVTDQTFAAERAEIDAENRAAVDVADSIRTELAAWFATQR